ncbi:MAG TPA: hypothetical protein DCE11_03120 [Ruminiclostridium sp.]|jgi:hypothetical protein|nr:hypothetical protein [Ruminiclostridium sp.]
MRRKNTGGLSKKSCNLHLILITNTAIYLANIQALFTIGQCKTYKPKYSCIGNNKMDKAKMALKNI